MVIDRKIRRKFHRHRERERERRMTRRNLANLEGQHHQNCVRFKVGSVLDFLFFTAPPACDDPVAEILSKSFIAALYDFRCSPRHLDSSSTFAFRCTTFIYSYFFSLRFSEFTFLPWSPFGNIFLSRRSFVFLILFLSPSSAHYSRWKYGVRMTRGRPVPANAERVNNDDGQLLVN